MSTSTMNKDYKGKVGKHRGKLERVGGSWWVLGLGRGLGAGEGGSGSEMSLHEGGR